MNKKKALIGAAIVIVVAGAYFLFAGKKTRNTVSLETAKVTRTSISNVVTATGTVEPVTEVEVGTQVSGIIDKLYADYNDVVKAGQLIAEMDKVNLQAELNSASAQLASSKTEYEYQQKNYARSKVLYEKKLISDYDYETATYNYEKAKAANDALIADGFDGYLVNIAYPDKGADWGVDDGFGYDTGNIYSNGVKEVHDMPRSHTEGLGLDMAQLEKLSLQDAAQEVGKKYFAENVQN